MPFVRSDHIQSVLKAHTKMKDKLGQFPHPTYDTVLAAEIFKRQLNKLALAGTHFAVSVTELGTDVTAPKTQTMTGGQVCFLVTVSGHHPELAGAWKGVRGQANSELNQELKEHGRPLQGSALYCFTAGLDPTYHPLHSDTTDYYQRAFGKSVAAGNLNFTADVLPRLNEFRTKSNLDALLASVTTTKPQFGGKNGKEGFDKQLKRVLDKGGEDAPDPSGLLSRAKGDAPKTTTAPTPITLPTQTKKIPVKETGGTRDIVSEIKFAFGSLGGKDVLPVVAAAVAIRMELFGATTPDAIRGLNKLLGDIKRLARVYPRTDSKSKARPEAEALDAYDKFARALETLMRPPLVTEGPEARGSLPVVLDVPEKYAYLKAALEEGASKGWGGGPLGRFCAEPKSYFYALNQDIVEKLLSGEGVVGERYALLRGQLAFWYSSDGQNFSESLFVHGDGSEKTPGHGAYMLPCASCAQRSGLMTTGLNRMGFADPLETFPWMAASEKDLFQLLQDRFSLQHFQREVLVKELLDHREKVKKGLAKPDFVAVLKDRARRSYALDLK